MPRRRAQRKMESRAEENCKLHVDQAMSRKVRYFNQICAQCTCPLLNQDQELDPECGVKQNDPKKEGYFHDFKCWIFSLEGWRLLLFSLKSWKSLLKNIAIFEEEYFSWTRLSRTWIWIWIQCIMNPQYRRRPQRETKVKQFDQRIQQNFHLSTLSMSSHSEESEGSKTEINGRTTEPKYCKQQRKGSP